MRYRILLLLMLLFVTTAAPAQVSIGINFSVFPEFVRVPGYPVYYAPQQSANYFFYDGMYWIYQNDEWYSSDWYNGPWWRMAPEYVPVFVLRIPVRYYRRPPAYFRGWGRDAPPRWGEHWGRDWEQRRSGWDKWDRRAAPAAAPLPTYQRQYSGSKYPKVEEQRTLQSQKYRYQPKDALVREQVRPQTQGAPAPAARERQQEPQRKDAVKDSRERVQTPSAARQPSTQAEPAVQQQRAQPQQAAPREQQTPRPAVQQERPQAQPVTPREVDTPREQQRPQSQQTPQRESVAPREQPAPRPAVQQERPQSQPTPQREPQRPQAEERGSQDKSAPREQANEPNRGRDNAPEKSRDKGDERGRDSGK
jgi:hypothetical protein